MARWQESSSRWRQTQCDIILSHESPNDEVWLSDPFITLMRSTEKLTWISTASRSNPVTTCVWAKPCLQCPPNGDARANDPGSWLYAIVISIRRLLEFPTGQTASRPCSCRYSWLILHAARRQGKAYFTVTWQVYLTLLSEIASFICFEI